MADRTAIAWTDATWNPIRGCTRVSAGCENCYAEATAYRFSQPGLPFQYLAARPSPSKRPRWTGHVMHVPKLLDLPLRWRRPRRIFVASVSDPFHDRVDIEFRDRMFAVMALAERHTFQLLPKRVRLARAYLSDPDVAERVACEMVTFGEVNGAPCPRPDRVPRHLRPRWPLRNVQLIASVENQETADERIPELLRVPAALHGISAEPLLGPIQLNEAMLPCLKCGTRGWVLRGIEGPAQPCDRCKQAAESMGVHIGGGQYARPGNRLRWVIIGGESGPHSRPFDVAWARDLIEECRLHEVPVFMKQLGAAPFANGFPLRNVAHPKGERVSEWPAGLDVQQFPTAVGR